MDNVTVFKTLKAEDIQEKVDLNLKKGMSLDDIKYSLLEEKHDFERNVLRQQVQIQNLKEQIEYVNYLISKREGK